MNLKDFLTEGPVRKLRNGLLATKWHVDTAEQGIKDALRSLEVYQQDPKNNSGELEQMVTHMKEALKALRGLKRLLKKQNA